MRPAQVDGYAAHNASRWIWDFPDGNNYEVVLIDQKPDLKTGIQLAEIPNQPTRQNFIDVGMLTYG